MFCHIGDLDYLCRMIVRSSTTQRLLIKLTLLLLLALGLPNKSAAMDSVPTRDRLCTVDSNDRQGHESVLNDVQHLYRIRSSRPERVVPSANPLPPHASGRVGLHHFYPHAGNAHTGFGVRREAAPFCSPHSCDYYVFALKRMRC